MVIHLLLLYTWLVKKAFCMLQNNKRRSSGHDCSLAPNKEWSILMHKVIEPQILYFGTPVVGYLVRIRYEKWLRCKKARRKESDFMQTEHISNIHPDEHLNEEHCWRSVLARDIQANGTFVYAVRSTGIYCRPSCPARRPHRENVTFFRLPEIAEATGFRACLRCHPRHTIVPDSQGDLIEQVCRYIIIIIHHYRSLF